MSKYTATERGSFNGHLPPWFYQYNECFPVLALCRICPTVYLPTKLSHFKWSTAKWTRVISTCMHACWVAQLCLTLCDPMDCGPPSSSVYGILQARILEWVAISFSRGSSRPRDWTRVSCIVGRFHCTYVPYLLYPFLCQWTNVSDLVAGTEILFEREAAGWGVWGQSSGWDRVEKSSKKHRFQSFRKLSLRNF